MGSPEGLMNFLLIWEESGGFHHDLEMFTLSTICNTFHMVHIILLLVTNSTFFFFVLFSFLQSYGYLLSYYWTNDDIVRKALGIHKVIRITKTLTSIIMLVIHWNKWIRIGIEASDLHVVHVEITWAHYCWSIDIIFMWPIRKPHRTTMAKFN